MPEDDGWGEYTEVVTEKQLPGWKRAYLRVPGRVRNRILWRVFDRETQIYNWRVQKLVQKLRPAVVVVYDMHWLGQRLRKVIDWPCRLIFGQRGLSYRFSAGYANQVYSLDSFDVVWTLSHASYRVDRDRMILYEPAVTVLPNCVDTERFRPASQEEKQRLRQQWGLPPDRDIVLLLSRRVPKKGAHLFLEAWPRILEEHPDALLWIVGGGDTYYERYLRRLSRALGVEESIHMEGHVEGDHTHACYRAADLYAFPTLASEAIGLTLLEAMACGLPCVASSYDAGREYFSEEEVCFVPDPHLKEAFANPVMRVLKDKALRHKLGSRARQVMEERFSYEIVFPQMKAFLQRQAKLAGAIRE